MNKVVISFFFILLIISNYFIWTSIYGVIQSREVVEVATTEQDSTTMQQKSVVETNAPNDNILSGLNIPWIVSFAGSFLLFMILTVSRFSLLTYTLLIVGCLLGGGVSFSLGEAALNLTYISYLFLSCLGGIIIGVLCLILDNITDKDTDSYDYYTFKEKWTPLKIVGIQFYSCLETNKIHIKIGESEPKEFFKLR
jgi:hypothetical protein